MLVLIHVPVLNVCRMPSPLCYSSHDIELLAPAGNWQCARAAVANGANAIFFGLPAFNARLRADNFREEELPELMTFLHQHGVRGLVTMNTLIFTSELEAAAKQLQWLEQCGVDAVIVQDLGLASLVTQLAPKLALHASTQMTITSPEGLSFIAQILPIKRAVLARELAVKELLRFSEKNQAPAIPLEVFVHGALCVAYSGQCLTSESLGQRSANRGECAQACRMPYELVVDGQTKPLGEVRYLLSPQDLAAVDLIPDLLAAGIRSFKVEGRLKSPEYVAAVTAVYRKAIDAAIAGQPAAASADDRYALEMTFSRGLSTGWLAGTNHPALTHGRFGKKRGALLGTISRVGGSWIELEQSHHVPLQAGDGVVFDAGEDRNHEQGGRIWKIEAGRIYFHRTFAPLDWSRIHVGYSVWKTSDPRLERELRKSWQQAKLVPHREPLHVEVSGSVGEKLRMRAREIEVISTSELKPAQQHPLDRERLWQQLERLGGTPFVLSDLTVHLAGDCHLALSEINAMRRELVERLQADVPPAPAHRTTPDVAEVLKACLPAIPAAPAESVMADVTLRCLCRNLQQLAAALDAGIEQCYCDFEDPRLYRDAVSLAGRERVILATPRIIKSGEIGYLSLIDRMGAAGMLIRNLAALQHYAGKTESLLCGDFSLNVANPLTAQLLRQTANLQRLTISYDLSISQVLDLLHQAPPEWFELTLHQHMPLFHMEHCVFCTFMSSGTSYKDCGRPCEKHTVHLRDRVGQLHRLSADVGCRNTLFNGRAQTGVRYFDSLRAAGLRHVRIELLDENATQTQRIIRLYQQFLQQTLSAEHVREELGALSQLGVTEGTWREESTTMPISR